MQPENQTSANQIPQPVQVPSATTQQPLTALKQTPLVYLSGLPRISERNRHVALLEWGADNRIRLYVKDFQGQQNALLLDCAPQEIKSFSTGVGMGNLKLHDGRLFRLDFSMNVAGMLMASTGAAVGLDGLSGLAISTAIDKKAVQVEADSGLTWWIQNLARYGVGGLQTTAETMYKINKIGWWALGIMFGIFALFGLFAAVVYLISQ